ncbi:mechanosensitive ion channel family protein [Mobiluncus curtisii]|uniref:Transporter, small conductance mechanosensitive ion channel MscS family protein n=1 Tax=Mobiluncus curtisii ATCC 51333 TaxID=887326 RepID=E6LZW3_9ACTO|nr:mechanosensitive ion channel domain-containing protein [Mobiluncus curtisii]EFU79723.1 transporter, small conductance mechanosensitive ion channel MscS family protein [Mobiluncus curtisii ATCC 51333]
MSFVFSPTPEPSPTPDKAVKEVLETSLDIMAVLAASLVCIVALLAAAQVIGFLLRRWGRKHRLIKYMERRSRVGGSLTCIALGATIGWYWTVRDHNVPGYGTISHGLLILMIIAVTVWLIELCAVLEDMTRTQLEGGSKPNRLVTQAQVMHRVSQVFFGVFGAISIALTFPEARAAMGSVLASAGIISLIAGIAAQGVLANMFAGLQIAFSDPIRVGDVVVVQGQQGTIEEITLTYIVIHLWDERRLILPSKKFTEEPFENWTKRDTHLLGVVELRVDWRLPLAAFRNEVDRLLSETDLWDGRTSSVQVTDSSVETMLVRLVASAANSGDLWDLKCYLRERLIEWIEKEAPYALPRRRIETDKVTEVHLPVDEIEIEKQARELAIATIRKTNSSRHAAATKKQATEAAPTSPYGEPLLDQYARKIQEKRRSWRFKARRLDETHNEKPEQLPPSRDALQDTRVLSTTATITGDRLYSGTPDAEERRKLVTGPKQSEEKTTADSDTATADPTTPPSEETQK